MGIDSGKKIDLIEGLVIDTHASWEPTGGYRIQPSIIGQIEKHFDAGGKVQWASFNIPTKTSEGEVHNRKEVGLFANLDGADVAVFRDEFDDETLQYIQIDPTKLSEPMEIIRDATLKDINYQRVLTQERDKKFAEEKMDNMAKQVVYQCQMNEKFPELVGDSRLLAEKIKQEYDSLSNKVSLPDFSHSMHAQSALNDDMLNFAKTDEGDVREVAFKNIERQFHTLQKEFDRAFRINEIVNKQMKAEPNTKANIERGLDDYRHFSFQRSTRKSEGASGKLTENLKLNGKLIESGFMLSVEGAKESFVITLHDKNLSPIVEMKFPATEDHTSATFESSYSIDHDDVPVTETKADFLYVDTEHEPTITIAGKDVSRELAPEGIKRFIDAVMKNETLSIVTEIEIEALYESTEDGFPDESIRAALDAVEEGGITVLDISEVSGPDVGVTDVIASQFKNEFDLLKEYVSKSKHFNVDKENALDTSKVFELS